MTCGSRRTEAARERQELRGVMSLRAQGQHLVGVERPLELAELGRPSTAGEVDPGGFDAERRQGFERDHDCAPALLSCAHGSARAPSHFTRFGISVRGSHSMASGQP